MSIVRRGGRPFFYVNRYANPKTVSKIRYESVKDY